MDFLYFPIQLELVCVELRKKASPLNLLPFQSLPLPIFAFLKPYYLSFITNKAGKVL